MQLSERDWLVISNFILMMGEAKDCTTMRTGVLRSLQRLIPYDLASFYLANNDDSPSLLKDPIGIGFDPKRLEHYAQRHSGDAPLSWTNEYPRNLDIRDSDAISYTDRHSSWYYTSVKKEYNVEHFLTLGLAHGGRNVGLLTLMRTSNNEDFSQKDIFTAQQLVDHIALALSRFEQVEEETSTARHLLHRARNIARINNLSSREEEVFLLLCKCLTPLQICDELSISEGTFKKHASGIYHKLHITSRYEILAVLIPEFTNMRP